MAFGHEDPGPENETIGPARRKKVDVRAAALIAEEMTFRNCLREEPNAACLDRARIKSLLFVIKCLATRADQVHDAVKGLTQLTVYLVSN